MTLGSMAPGGVPWHAMGGTMATIAATATALHGNLTACHEEARGTPMSTARRLGSGLGFHGMPWRSVEGSVDVPWKMPWLQGCSHACHPPPTNPQHRPQVRLPSNIFRFPLSPQICLGFLHSSRRRAPRSCRRPTHRLDYQCHRRNPYSWNRPTTSEPRD